MIDSEDAAKAWLATVPGVDSTVLARLECLVSLLADENERQTLVSHDSLGHIWQRHVADSMQLLSHVPRETPLPWLDLGTGAGFPGLVIAATRPGQRVILTESRSRRADWLRRAVQSLDLSNVEVIGQRLETLDQLSVSVISARAFAPLDRLLKLAARFSTGDTYWVLPKGRSAREELDGLIGWAHNFEVVQSVTDPSAGIVIGTLAGVRTREKGRSA